MATLEFDSVTKVYRGTTAPAVDNFSLRIDDGQIVGLLGSSGCGKTTTLRAAAGFVTVDSGAIRADGRDIHKLPCAQRGIAMAFEGYALYPPLTVRQNITFALSHNRRKANGTTRGAADDEVEHIAAMLEITNALDKRPDEISAGEQQRTSLARALVRKAPITLLDEPMSQLEPRLRAVLRARIKEYMTRHRLTVVFVTHDQNEATALADKIAVMENGVLQQFATPAAIKQRPANLFVAGFIGEPPMNLLPATAVRGDNRVDVTFLDDARQPVSHIAFAESELGGNLDAVSASASAILLGIRPHRVQLGGGDLRGKIVSLRWLGDQTHVLVEFCGRHMIAVSDIDVRNLRQGEEVGIGFAAADINIFGAPDATEILAAA